MTTKRLVIDVREAWEYAASHVNGAINIPLDQIASSKDMPKTDAEIILYCNSGNRSGVAEQILRSNGYKHVANGISQSIVEAKHL